MKLLDTRRKKRIVFMFGFICVLLTALCGKLVWIQGVKAIEYSDLQAKMLMQRLPITASRGDIYDRNMNLLAKDATSSSIYVRPVDIDESMYKEISTFLSDQLDLKYDYVYEKVSNVDSSSELIQRKVDNSIAMEIQNQEYFGVEIAEDKKRYYTNGSFASHILGFTGSDHQGLYGIEAVYDDILKGTDGVTIFETDGRGSKIPSGTEIRQEPVDGNNLVLTIDNVIQMYTENAIEKGLEVNDAKSVMAVVLDPNTGEILSMATTPGYNLDDPWELSDEFIESYKSDFTYEDENGNTQNLTESEKQFMMWENPIVNYNYEPGSTFKMITVSAALEEGTVTEDTQFYCGGSKQVADRNIECWIHPRSHGSQSLSETVANSCNPAMMEITMRMGPDTFYKYIYNYGFGSKTGIALSGEESGIVPPNENVKMVDFVTRGFGQGIAVTPIQMAMAGSAVINGGYLLEPQIVKYVTQGEDNEIVNENGKEVVRQVISEETSDTMKDFLREVVTSSSLISGYDSEQIQMGGKTGTAQKIIDGQYSDSKYVCSFFGFAPYDNPEIAVLVLVDEPINASTGSAAAAPIAAEILENSMNYIKTKNTSDSTAPTITSKVIVPDLRGYTLKEAEDILDSLNIKYSLDSKGSDNDIVISQNYSQKEYSEEVVLEIGQLTNEDKVVVPDVTGMSIQGASEAFENIGLKIEVNGGGIAYSQSVKAGTYVEKGSVIEVEFRYIE